MRKVLIRALFTFLIVITSISFIGCATRVKDGPPNYYVDLSKIPNAKPKRLPRSKYGNPNSYVVFGKRYHVLKTARNYKKRGIASWYGTKFQGQPTSSREPYNMLAMTGASPVLPIPCFVRVTNLENGRSVILKINDRGPFAPNRIIDLSYVAAKKLGYANKGTALVQVQTINFKDYSTKRPIIVTQTSPEHPKLYLQLGAFRELAHAEHLKARVESFVQKPVIIHKGLFHDLPIYRVQIGPLVGVRESDRLLEKLRKFGFNNAMTVIS